VIWESCVSQSSAKDCKESEEEELEPEIAFIDQVELVVMLGVRSSLQFQ
jgi:hypothetical protein